MRVFLLTTAPPAPALAEYAKRLGADIATEPAESDVRRRGRDGLGRHRAPLRRAREAARRTGSTTSRTAGWGRGRPPASPPSSPTTSPSTSSPPRRGSAAALADLRPDARCELVTSGAPDGPAALARTDPSARPRPRPLASTSHATRTAPLSPHGGAPRGRSARRRRRRADAVGASTGSSARRSRASVPGRRRWSGRRTTPATSSSTARTASSPTRTTRAAPPASSTSSPATAISSRGCRRRRRRPARRGRRGSSRRTSCGRRSSGWSPRTRRRRPPGPSASWATRSAAPPVFGREHATLTAEVHRLQGPAAAGQAARARALKRRAKARLKG